MMIKEKDRVINLLVAFIKLIWDGSIMVTIEQAQKFVMIKEELNKLGLDLIKKLDK